jgi:hypothetical protein
MKNKRDFICFLTTERLTHEPLQTSINGSSHPCCYLFFGPHKKKRENTKKDKKYIQQKIKK